MISRVVNKLKRDGFFPLVVAIIKYPSTAKKRKPYNQMLAKTNIKERFSEIYNKKFWLKGESLSGEGSEVAYTQPLRNWLICTIPKLGVRRFVDAPCGDFNWMKLVVPLIDIEYTGLDIVDSVIEKNNTLFANKTITFQVGDICEDELPSCDLLMVRDCLFHLSYEDIQKFLRNLERTDYKYLLTTTHIVDQGFKNSNITTGHFRFIDLFKEPFNFNPNLVKDRVKDYPEGYPIHREMILIEKIDVPTKLSSI